LLNCDPDEYDILRQFGRDRTVFPISKASLRHNRHIKPILYEFAPKAAQIIIDAGLARDLSKIDLDSTPAASRCARFGIIYALYNQDGILIKIGITFNVDERNEEYREEFEDYDENYKMIELVAFDSIPLDVEQELSKLFCEFMDSVIENKTTPTGLRLFVINLRERGWHRGGEKVHWIIQLCEVGFQLYYKLPRRTIMGEAFMWDQQKCKDHCDKAMEVAESLVSMIGGFEDTICSETGNTLPTRYERSAIGTWKPGEPDGVISSLEAHIWHILGDSGYYQDVINKALYPNAKTVEKRFATNFPIDWYKHGLNSFVIQLDDLFWNRNDGVIRLVLVDAQDFMFGNLFEPQRLILEIGYVYCGEELGGEVIVYRAGNVVLYLHGMPSLASDPRKKIPMERKQLRAIALDGMKGSMDLITGELDNVDNITTSNILGSLYAENIIRGGHGDRLFASAVQRDMLMPDGKNAIDRFRGGITIHDIMYPCTREARRQWKGLGGPAMPDKWWLEAETQKEALAKRHGTLPFNREGAMSLFKAGIRSLIPGTLSKEKRAKGLEWQRRMKVLERLRQKDEAEYFEQHGMSREEANQKYPRQKTVKNPPRPLEVQAQREERDRKLQAQREERDRKLTEKKRSADTTVSSSDVQASRPPKRQKKSEDLSTLTVVQLKDRLRGLNLAVSGRKQELIDRLKTNAAKVKQVTSVYRVAKRRQGFTFTITKPETGKFGLIVRDLKVSYDGNIKCTTEVESIASGSVFGDTPLKSGMALEFINGHKCFSYKRAVELLQKATGEIEIIATLYA